MNKPESPCLECKKRVEKCHSKCRSYRVYKGLLERYKERINNLKEAESRTYISPHSHRTGTNIKSFQRKRK